MARRLFDQLINWANGVVTSANPDALPPDASPRGLNSAFYNIGPVRTDIGNRKGAVLINETPLTSTPKIIGQTEFRKSDASKFHLLFGSNGSVWHRTGAATTTLLATPFTAGDENFPEFAVANDLLFITNGEDQKKFDGADFTNFGIERPAAPTVGLNAAATTQGMSGEYDIAISYYNDISGQMSSRSDEVLINNATAKKIDVSWSAPSDPQVSHVFIHIRKRDLGSLLYQLPLGMTPAPDATGGHPVAVTAVVIDVADDEWQDFIIEAPGTDDHDPPPADARFSTWHKSRMFVATKSAIYWSAVEEPESFDLENRQEPVNPDDGDEIRGMASTPEGLLILKRKRVYLLLGDEPNSFELVLISGDTGTESHHSIVTARDVTFWWSSLGPVAKPVGGKVEYIGQDFISATIEPELLNTTKLNLIHAVNDEDRQRIIFAVPETSSTRNTFLLPWSYRKNRFESTAWNPMDVASMTLATDEGGNRFVYLGGYSGQVFKFWSGYNDGIPSGTTSGDVTSSTDTTLTDSTAAFVTAGGKLTERYVYAISQDQSSVQRRRITTNTATQLTVTPAWSVNPNDTYSYVIGGIDFQWDTPWVDTELPFIKKRYEFLFAQISSQDVDITILVDVFFSYDSATVQKQKSFVLGGAAVYGAPTGDGPSYYDISKYAAASTLNVKLRMAKTAHAWRARIRALTNDQEVILNKVAMQSVRMSEKDVTA